MCFKIDLNNEQVLKSFEQLVSSQSFKAFEHKSCQLQVTFLELIVFSWFLLRYKRHSCVGYSSSVCSFFVLLF